MRAPELKNSTKEERRQYIKSKFKCIADCDMCGLCTVFRGKCQRIISNWEDEGIVHNI